MRRRQDLRYRSGAWLRAIGTLAREAISLAARLEGLFVDPVYTAKTLAVLIALVRDLTIARGSRVLFVHTGGLPALFGYEQVLRAANHPSP